MAIDSGTAELMKTVEEQAQAGLMGPLWELVAHGVEAGLPVTVEGDQNDVTDWNDTWTEVLG